MPLYFTSKTKERKIIMLKIATLLFDSFAHFHIKEHSLSVSVEKFELFGNWFSLLCMLVAERHRSVQNDELFLIELITKNTEKYRKCKKINENFHCSFYGFCSV